MTKMTSPCIGVCKYKREGHCIGCSMTEDQKKIYKSLKNNRFRQGFLTMLDAQQQLLGDYGHWEKAYDRKCHKVAAKASSKK